MEQKRPSVLKRIDWVLVIITLVIFLFGLVAIASATSPAYDEDEMTVMQYIKSLLTGYVSSQTIYFIISVGIVIALMFVDYTNMKDFTDYLYWGCVLILLAVRVFGTNQRGMVGWFRIGSVGIQPAELCKPIMIIVWAREFSKVTEGQQRGPQTFREIWPAVWRFIIPFVLICIQPDVGTGLVYAAILLGMLFMAKTSFKVLGPIIGAVLIMLPIAWFSISDTQQERILVFLDPMKDPLGSGFNVLRAKTASSSGGMWGKGLFSQNLLTQRSNFLPEKQTDFIFSSTVEAVGFFGGFIIILLYIIWMLRMLNVSMKAKDDFGSFICIGTTFMILFHVFENIGMNIGVMPVTGIPLPLFSAGGSNVLATMVAVGLVLNVHFRRTRRIGGT